MPHARTRNRKNKFYALKVRQLQSLKNFLSGVLTSILFKLYRLDLSRW